MSIFNPRVSPIDLASEISGILSPGNGGTGINNGVKTLTIGGNVSITTAAATVLDDTTVAFMVNTLGGASSIGTGGIVRGTSPTLTTPVLTAPICSFSALIDATTININLAASSNFNLTLGGNRTLGIPTNQVAGQSGVISVRQDITGSRTLSYAWPYQFIGGSAPTLSTGKLVFDQLMYSVNNYSTAAVTLTIATPCVVTWTAHGLISGQRLQLTTTGALPTGLSINTTYFVTVVTANTFNLSTTLANAQTATFIATSGTQSGIHTAVSASITLAINPAVA